MCLITLNWQPGELTSLRVVANRDEFYARPTNALRHWPGQQILAGQDLQAGGTWLGLGVCAASGQIRLAALTNYRDVAGQKPDAASRGHLTCAFLQGSMSAKSYLESLATGVRIYNPFNLVLFDGQDLMAYESRHQRMFALTVGITSVSNADFNTPWPKLEKLHHAFDQTLQATSDEVLLREKCFKLLSDEQMAPDGALPQTGLSLDRERVLSAAFIRTPDYGTRASSVIAVQGKRAQCTERSFDSSGFKGEVTEIIFGSNT